MNALITTYLNCDSPYVKSMSAGDRLPHTAIAAKVPPDSSVSNPELPSAGVELNKMTENNASPAESQQPALLPVPEETTASVQISEGSADTSQDMRSTNNAALPTEIAVLTEKDSVTPAVAPMPEEESGHKSAEQSSASGAGPESSESSTPAELHTGVHSPPDPPLPPDQDGEKDHMKTEEDEQHHNDALSPPSPLSTSPRISVFGTDGSVSLLDNMDIDGESPPSPPREPEPLHKTVSVPVSNPMAAAPSSPTLMVEGDSDRTPERLRRPSILRRFSAYDDVVQGFPRSQRRSSTVSFDEKETVHYVYSSRTYDRSYSKTEEELATAYIPRHMMMGGMW